MRRNLRGNSLAVTLSANIIDAQLLLPLSPDKPVLCNIFAGWQAPFQGRFPRGDTGF